MPRFSNLALYSFHDPVSGSTISGKNRIIMFGLLKGLLFSFSYSFLLYVCVCVVLLEKEQ